jgi:ribosomal protein L37E
MPTIEQIKRVQRLEPDIIVKFCEYGSIKKVSVVLNVSQTAVKRVVVAAGLSVMPRFPRGQENGAWKGNAIRTASGRSRARTLYQIGPCERCGQASHDRHHKDDNTKNNHPDNIEILCRRCHMMIDGRLDKLRKLGKPRKRSALVNCQRCGREFFPLRKGRCEACASYFYKHGTERPKALIAARGGYTQALRG